MISLQWLLFWPPFSVKPPCHQPIYGAVINESAVNDSLTWLEW